MLSTLRLRLPSGPVRVILSRLIRFWPWLVASAAIHGLLLIGWLGLKSPDSAINPADSVVIELVSIDAQAEKSTMPPTPTALPVQKKENIHHTITKMTAVRQPLKKVSAVTTTVKKTASLITRAKARIQRMPEASTSKMIQLTKNAQESTNPIAQHSMPLYASHAAKVDMNKSRLLIRKHLESFKYYPASARRRGIEGHVEVGFTLTHDGAADQVAVLHGSGYAVLDHAALETVYRAQPFPVEGGKYRFSLRFKRL